MSSVIALPREEAIATALLPDYEAIRPGILNIVMQIWAREDPAGAYAAFESLPEFDFSYLLDAQILQLWLNSDPETALSIAANSNYETTFNLVLRGSGPQHAGIRTRRCSNLPGNDGRRRMARGD